MRTRVPFLLLSALVIVALVAGISACGDGGSGGGTSTTVGGSGGAPASRPGGTLSVATEPGTIRDPALASARSDILLNQQIYDWLVEIGETQPAPPRPGHGLGLVRRQGVDLHPALRRHLLQRAALHRRRRGLHLQPPAGPQRGLAACQDPARTSPRIKAVDATHVEFTLKDANPEFPSDVSDYHAAILSKSVPDPAKTWVGTGPFVLESYTAEDRAILKKNPSYWMKDDKGNALPYLDEIQLIFSPDLAGQVNALRGGQVQFVGGLTSELVDSIKGDSQAQGAHRTVERVPLRHPHALRRGPSGGRRQDPPGAAAGHRPPGRSSTR